MLLVLAVVCQVVYPLVVLGVSQGRTSASGNVGSTSGRSNLVPSREQQRRAIDNHRAQLMKANPDALGAVPDDALTVSPSGQEANVSAAYALWQVPRVAKARHVPELQVRQVIQRHTQERVAGFLGEPRVNILELNLALGTRAPKG